MTRSSWYLAMGILMVAAWTASAAAQAGVPEGGRIEVSDDGHQTVAILPPPQPPPGGPLLAGGEVPYGAAPDWSNTLRVQVGGLQVHDMNGDGRQDVVVGCYISNSFPPYDDWHNFIYYNTGTQLEATPSWTSSDQVSTGDVQVGLINADAFPDVFAANGGFPMDPSVIYFGTASGPSTTPGWIASDVTWTNYARLFDFDHDGDLDVATANQGNSQNDPYRPMHIYRNAAGTLETMPSWSSAETSIQNFLDFGDYDGDDWEDLAVSKWANFESGIYKNNAGTIATTPVWTTGDTDTDKGVSFADVDGNEWLDLALGHDPTLVYTNEAGTLTPTFASTANFFGHSEIRWQDVDGDGDDDLAEIHFSNGHVYVYLNREGTLDTAPTWTYDSPGAGTAIAFGDINGDHLPDLVVGNSGNPSIMVFYNQAEPRLFEDGFESGDTNQWPMTVESP